jgi:predicted RNA-binding protein YlqC (UPF0109 family)
MPDPRDVSVYALLFRIVCAIVDHPHAVRIRTVWVADGASFAVRVHPNDLRTLAGRGHNARSVQNIIKGAGLKLGTAV